MEKVGKDGVITVEESKSMLTELELVEGMQFDRGYVSPYMVDDMEKKTATLEEPLILVTDKKISTNVEIVPLLEKIMESGRKLLIVSEDLEGEALTTIVVNKLRGAFDIVAVKAPDLATEEKTCFRTLRFSPEQSISLPISITILKMFNSAISAAREMSSSAKMTPFYPTAMEIKSKLMKESLKFAIRLNRPTRISIVKTSGAPCQALRRRSCH